MISSRKFLVSLHLGASPTANLYDPASTLSVFRPGSTFPSAILYDAWESFNQRSPKADDSIRSIRPDLAKAVDDCIDAAGQEWEPYWQRQLLNVCHNQLAYFPFLICSSRQPSLAGVTWTCIILRTLLTWGKH